MLSDLAEDAKNFGRSVGRDGFRRVLEDIFTTFPDWHVEINLAEFFWTPAVVKTVAEDSERSSSLLRVVEIDKGVLVVAHGTLWRQSFNYKTPFRAATIANPFKYLPADNNIAVRAAGDYPRTEHVGEFLCFFHSFFIHDFLFVR